MAELADAHDSGSCVRTYLQVQVLFPAQTGDAYKSSISGFFYIFLCSKIPKKSLTAERLAPRKAGNVRIVVEVHIKAETVDLQRSQMCGKQDLNLQVRTYT